MSEQNVIVGRIIGIWGVAGQLKVRSLSDNPHRFDSGGELNICDERYKIKESRQSGEYLIIKFHGLDAPDAAQKLVGFDLAVERATLTELGEGCHYHYDLVGMVVMTASGENVGSIIEVLSTPANDVFVVRSNLREILIPVVKDVVKSIDTGLRQVTIEAIEGLLD